MKRFLGASLALAVTLSSQPGHAELLKNFRLGGQIDFQATSAHNVNDFSTKPNIAPVAGPTNYDRVGDAQERLLVHLDWDLLDDVHARVSAHGQGNFGATSPDKKGGASKGSGRLDEAYFKVDKVAGQVDATFGRQFFGTSGDIVIYFGPSDKAWYGLPVDYVDAVRLDWNSEWLGITGLVAKLYSPLGGNNLGVVQQADKDLHGLNIVFKGNDNISASIYGWNQLTHNTGPDGSPPTDTGAAFGKNDSLYVAGLKMKLAGGGFWLKGEFAQNFGDNRINPVSNSTSPAAHYAGWAAVGNTGFKVESDNVGMFSLWGEIAAGSGRQRTRENVHDGFVPINSDYRPGTIYGRFAANAMSAVALGSTVDGVAAVGATSSSSLSNRLIWGSGIRMSPAVANKLVIGASFWDFRIHRFLTGPKEKPALQGNRHIGSELDVDLTWTHSENVAFATGWGQFQPGGLIKEAIRALAPTGGRGNNPITLVYFDTRVKF